MSYDRPTLNYGFVVPQQSTPTSPKTTPVTTPSSPANNPSTKSPTSPKPKAGGGSWCLPKGGVSDAQLQANLDYACGRGLDCSAIQPGGACFEPNTIASHAAYAMNLFFQNGGRDPWTCDFSQSATLSSNNPSLNTQPTPFCFILRPNFFTINKT